MAFRRRRKVRRSRARSFKRRRRPMRAGRRRSAPMRLRIGYRM